MLWDGPIVFHNVFAGQVSPFFLKGCAANALKWVHCIHCCCCQFTYLGTFLLQVLPIPLGGPIAFTATAADFFT